MITTKVQKIDISCMYSYLLNMNKTKYIVLSKLHILTYVCMYVCMYAATCRYAIQLLLRYIVHMYMNAVMHSQSSNTFHNHSSYIDIYYILYTSPHAYKVMSIQVFGYILLKSICVHTYMYNLITIYVYICTYTLQQ